MFSFHLGKPVLVMLCVSVAAGVGMAFRPAPPPRDLEYWVFAKSQLSVFREPGKNGEPSLAQIWNETSDRKVEVKNVAVRAMDTRLISLLMSGATGERVPDLVSLDIGSVGKYFRFPVDEVGLLPLDRFLDRGGWRAHLVASRLAPWTRGGKVFGIPYDVHPTVITFRRDLWEEAGIDLPSCDTWEKFHDGGVKYRAYWRGKGLGHRMALELPDTGTQWLGPLIVQRGVNLVDSNLKSHLTDDRVVDTLVRYAQMVAGPNRIATEASPGGLAWVRDFDAGAIGAFFTPDWRVNYLRGAAPPSLVGKLGMMPVPRWDPIDAPTITTGGTMVGIPRNARDPEASWKLIEHFYLSDIAQKTRLARIDIVPAVMDTWKDPKFSKPDPLYGGQMTGELFVALAAQVPRFNATPFNSTASGVMASLLQKQVRLIESGADVATQLEYARKNLADADAYLKRAIAFSAFE